jgi:2,5-diketo-D-gluconate reductase B
MSGATAFITARGLHLPRLGLGTGLLRNAPGQASIEVALSLGYRHLDTAEMYTNEATVGAAIAASGVPRRDIHITTKMLPEHMEPVAVRRSIERSLTALSTDYVDLYLIHWHIAGMDLAATLHTMMRLQEEGYARAIGVCNFTVALLRQAVEEIGAPIACNQIEYHVLLDQSEVLRYARSHGIAVIAYAPLARGRFFALPEMRHIARKHAASPAQVGLKWLLDQELVAAIPRAGRRESQQENLDALRLVLDDDDRAAIARLPKDQRVVNVDFAPVWDPPEVASLSSPPERGWQSE